MQICAKNDFHISVPVTPKLLYEILLRCSVFELTVGVGQTDGRTDGRTDGVTSNAA